VQTATRKRIDRSRVASFLARERERFAAEHPRSGELHRRARESLLDGVPMNWMTRWPGDFPVFLASASGSELTDVDGNVYVDLCLGDTGAMTGHSPAPTVRAATEQLGRGITAMLPTEDAAAVGEDMRSRFGLSNWQFTLSATDANRFMIRLAREITGRPRIMVHNHCYHGSVDETVATLVGGEVRARLGNMGPPVDPALTTRVVEFNDIPALERELGTGDVAVVLAERIHAHTTPESTDVGGVGGTLAANALSLAAARATLAEVLTDEAFERMIALGERFEEGVATTIAERRLPWTVTRLGCRVEYMFAPTRPRTGSEAAASMDDELDSLLHLYMLNRGVLMTPFHMMALMSPATSETDVDRHTAAFAEAAGELAG
jgi:glutamate-1-semialdehyde aminotransferase